MIVRSNLVVSMLAGFCLSVSALASGWTVNVSQSDGFVNPGTAFIVPFTVNTNYYSTTPITTTVNTLH